MDPFGQICHAPTIGNFLWPWLSKGFQYFGLKYGYHQLPLREGDKVKTTFWGINHHRKDCLYI
jgi:hypothetical protein